MGSRRTREYPGPILHHTVEEESRVKHFFSASMSLFAAVFVVCAFYLVMDAIT